MHVTLQIFLPDSYLSVHATAYIRVMHNHINLLGTRKETQMTKCRWLNVCRFGFYCNAGGPRSPSTCLVERTTRSRTSGTPPSRRSSSPRLWAASTQVTSSIDPFPRQVKSCVRSITFLQFLFVQKKLDTLHSSSLSHTYLVCMHFAFCLF